MAIEVVSASYPGVTNIKGGAISLPIGRRAGRITINAIGLAQSPRGVGDLDLVASESDTVNVPDCKLISVKKVLRGAEPSVTIVLADRRWRWDFGKINGEYNVQQGRKAVVAPKTPRELATLLADAMGEANVDVSAFPNVGEPEVRWHNAVAADELERLCRHYGLVMGMSRLNNNVVHGLKIFEANQGTGLPTLTNTFSETLDADRRIVPSTIAIQCGPTAYDCVLELEPVIRELDGSIVALEDCSYKPAGASWGQAFQSKFLSLVPTIPPTDIEKERKAQAERDVYKLYRVTGMVGGGGANGLNPPGYTGADVADLDGLRLLTHTNQPDVGSGSAYKRPAYVVGRHKPSNFQISTAKVHGAPIETGVSVDPLQKIVQTGAALYLDEDVAGTIQLKPATVYLVTAVEVLDTTTNYPTYYERVRTPVDANAAGPARVDLKSELRIEYTTYFTSDDSGITMGTPTDNQTDVDTEADYYLDGIEEEHKTRPAGGVSAYGIQHVDHAGDLHEANYSWGGGPPTTRAGYNMMVKTLRPYEEIQDEAIQRAAQQNTGGQILDAVRINNRVAIA